MGFLGGPVVEVSTSAAGAAGQISAHRSGVVTKFNKDFKNGPHKKNVLK